jgi:hypothetical protein
MADFSSSGILDLPATSAEALQRGDPRVLGWIKEAIQEGDLINRSDPSYDTIGRAQAYIVGEQLSPEHRRLKYLPQVIVNESRKAMQAHVSALTDLKPLAGWKSSPEYQVQADLLNKYLLYEWVSFFFDIELGEGIKYALAGGTGDLVVEWDPHIPLGGGNTLSARDPRDTLPIRPSKHRSPQLWEGVILREGHTVNVLRAMYPTKQYLFKPSTESALGTVMGRFRTLLSRLLTPADPLDLIGQRAPHSRALQPGGIVLYRVYLKDRTRNLTSAPIPMGTPGSAWSYVVGPNQPLYPRGRLIVATDDAIIWDGGQTYWHGMFPIARLMLWSLPWQFLGIPLFNDLLPVQDAINDTVHDIRLGIRQWMDPDIVYNRNAVSETTMRLLDPRRPGKRIKVQPGFGEPYERKEGPNPQVLSLALELWQQLTQKFTDLSGTANLSALLQLRQLPSADTIQKYYEALTPEIRFEARMIEAFLRDLSEMIKVNYFQFLSSAKRVQILGVGGTMLSDFDYDPGKLVPALKSGDPGYTPELDADLTTADQRAQFFHKQFVFVVAPNSVLAINATETKMVRLQLSRQGYYDFWSLHETLETPNVGAPPAIPLPPLESPPPTVLMGLIGQATQMAGQMAQAGGAGMMQPMAPPQFTDPQTGRTFTLDPGSGQLLEIRIPTTVTERLMAQALVGIGQTVSPVGRKATGQEAPQQETKSDGRTTITESAH